MSERHIPKRVQNYTNAFLGMMALILFMAFWVMAALWGFLSVLLGAAAINALIRLIGRDRSA